MKIHYTLLLSCCLCLWCYFGNAQLYTHAGLSRAICRGDSVILGGADTATNATAPFSYHWQPATGLSATDVPQPVARPAVTTTYYLTSSDANGVVSVDSVTLSVKFSDTYITASDTLVCPGQQVQLTAHVSSPFCGATATCTGNTLTPSIGTDTLLQPGNSVQPPTLFGNFLRSSRSQMLYTRAELQAALGGPAVIKALTFSNGVFNSSAFLQNFTIKMGCAFQDSLTTWNDNLFTVYSVGNYTPQPGWLNGIVLQTPYYWDGNSDLLIDICNYNPTTFGNQNNKAECTQTPFKSYLNSVGTTNQCGGGTTPTAYYLRPNVKFSYCTSAITPVPLIGYTISWNVDSTIAITDELLLNSGATINASGYCYFTISDNQCAITDSIFIATKNGANFQIIPDNNFCASNSNGAATVLVNTLADSVNYWLSAVNLSDTLRYGIAVNGDSINLSGLESGTYTLHVYDTICSFSTYNFNLTGTIVDVEVDVTDPISCYGEATGKACVTVANGQPPYTFLWDSIYNSGVCNDSLSAGIHYVLLRDTLGCEWRSQEFTINSPGVALVVNSSVNSDVLYLNMVSGATPYTIYWGDSTATTSIATAQHTYSSDGAYVVVVTDANGCEYTMTVTILGTGIVRADDGESFVVHPNPAHGVLYLSATKTAITNVTLCDAMGRYLTVSRLPTGNAIDISGLVNGVYVVAIETLSGSFTRRFVKE